MLPISLYYPARDAKYCLYSSQALFISLNLTRIVTKGILQWPQPAPVSEGGRDMVRPPHACYTHSLSNLHTHLTFLSTICWEKINIKYHNSTHIYFKSTHSYDFGHCILVYTHPTTGAHTHTHTHIHIHTAHPISHIVGIVHMAWLVKREKRGEVSLCEHAAMWDA